MIITEWSYNMILHVCVSLSVLFLSVGSAGEDRREDVKGQSHQQSVHLPQSQKAECLVEDGIQPVVGTVERISCSWAQHVVEIDMGDLRNKETMCYNSFPSHFLSDIQSGC